MLFLFSELVQTCFTWEPINTFSHRVSLSSLSDGLIIGIPYDVSRDWPHLITGGKNTPRCWFSHSCEYVFPWTRCVKCLMHCLSRWKNTAMLSKHAPHTHAHHREWNPLNGTVSGARWAKSQECSQFCNSWMRCVEKACADACLVSLYIIQLFWECQGPPWVGNDVRVREETEGKEKGGWWCMEADICCGIPEFRLHSVFGRQWSGTRLVFPLHLSQFLSSFPLYLSVPLMVFAQTRKQIFIPFSLFIDFYQGGAIWPQISVVSNLTYYIHCSWWMNDYFCSIFLPLLMIDWVCSANVLNC